MRLVFFILVLFPLFINNGIAEEMLISADKTVIQFETKLGIVTFPHKRHADLKITECKTCHHTSEPDDTVMKPCHECHQHKKTEISKAKTIFHERCIGCHEYTAAGGQHAGPLKKKCKLCHVKESEE